MIKLFKLVTGEEVIGSVEGALPAIVSKPRHVVETLNDRGFGVMFRPYFRGSPAQETLHLKPEHVIDTAPVGKLLEDAYLQATSGLLLAK